MVSSPSRLHTQNLSIQFFYFLLYGNFSFPVFLRFSIFYHAPSAFPNMLLLNFIPASRILLSSFLPLKFLPHAISIGCAHSLSNTRFMIYPNFLEENTFCTSTNLFLNFPKLLKTDLSDLNSFTSCNGLQSFSLYSLITALLSTSYAPSLCSSIHCFPFSFG